MCADIILNSGIKNDFKIFVSSKEKLTSFSELTDEHCNYISSNIEKKDLFHFDRISNHLIVIKVGEGKSEWRILDNLRKNGFTSESIAVGAKAENISCSFSDCKRNEILSFLEGFLLSQYRFDKYKTEKSSFSVKLVYVESELITEEDVRELKNIVNAVAFAKNLINEPVNFLNAQNLASIIASDAHNIGLNVEVLDKSWIEREGMGGILAVNQGSIDPPAFISLEHKPLNHVNERPIVLVGKGIVFDTGGLNIKTGSYMETMKADMGGAAAVYGAMQIVASQNLNLWLKAYIPVTDNRPGGNAYAPGDVIKMHNGIFVEVLNTDAEGRMILADALSYASKDSPELVIDVATLTGAAQAAVGEHAVVVMGSAGDSDFNKLEESSFRVCERIVRFPMWEEYGELIKSDIADIKNTGGPVAGSITAGKFLEHFTKYPWIHLDISGSAFISTLGNYRGKGGTGFGVRLLYDFLKTKTIEI